MTCCNGVWKILDELLKGPLAPLSEVIEDHDEGAAKRWSVRCELRGAAGSKAALALCRAAALGDLDSQDDRGMTVLHYASCAGSIALVQELIRAGINIDIQCHDGSTASGAVQKMLKTDEKTIDPKVLKEILRLLSNEADVREADRFADGMAWLSSVPVFRRLERCELPLLAGKFHREKFDPGEVLFRKGDPAEAFYVIQEGEAHVLDENEELIAVLRTGDYFGEAALISHKPRNATVRAAGSTTSTPPSPTNASVHTPRLTSLAVLMLDRDDFDKMDLRHKLRLPKREAIQPHVTKCDRVKEQLTVEQVNLIVTAMQKNPKLGPLLESFAQKELEAIAELGVSHQVPTGVAIVTQGDSKADLFYILEKGNVSIIRDGKECGQLAAGASFGEVALLMRSKRTATVKAKEPCSLWSLSASDLQEVTKARLQSKFDSWAKILENVPDLEFLSSYERNKIASSLVEVKFEADETIVTQGEVASEFYVLLEGSLHVSVDGKPVAQYHADANRGLHPHFGEQALLNDTPRTATVRTAAKSTVLVLSKEVFLGVKQMWGEDRPPLYNNSQATTTYRRSDLLFMKRLGAGAFGAVNLVEHAPTHSLFALKSLDKAQIDASESQKCVLNEKNVMRMTDSDFLVRGAAFYNLSSSIEFLMEAVLGGELRDIYSEKTLWGRNETVRFHVACTVKGLEHLHTRHILYRDLKPENLILDSKGYAKICDFGLAKFALGRAHTFCGTPDYLAPELGDMEGYTKAVDWWSLGILVFELMTSDTPWETSDPFEIVSMGKKGLQQKRVCWPEDAGSWKVFVLDLCQVEPNSRLPLRKGGMQKLELHPWYQEEPAFNWSALEQRTMTPPFKPELKRLNSSKGWALTEDPPQSTSDWACDFEDVEGAAPEHFRL